MVIPSFIIHPDYIKITILGARTDIVIRKGVAGNDWI